MVMKKVGIVANLKKNGSKELLAKLREWLEKRDVVVLDSITCPVDAMIQEVLRRRYRRAGNDEELYPDMILIDGGLGQLHAAQEAFR